MASNLNVIKELSKEKDRMNISEDMIKKDEKTDDFEEELENYKPKRRTRNSVYTYRPFIKPSKMNANNSLFILNTSDYVDILHKKYMFFINKYESILEDSSKMNKTLEENQKIIDDLNSQLKKMKEEKKKRQKDIVNFLSNKESLEEIFNNKVNYLTNKKKDEKSKFEEKEINLNLDIQKNKNPIDSQLYNIEDEKELEIKLEEIKKSDKKKFTEKVINLAEELLLKKGDEEFINKIKSKIKIAYNIFFSEISSNSVINNESIISHFFSRIGLYISNHSLGQYSETSVNKFLRYLLKINSINVEIAQIMKFLNKKYKEQKNQMKNKMDDLKKKNENLKEKKKVNDINLEKYEKIIQKNKENIKNIKNNEQLDGPKKKYAIHTIDRAYLRKNNKLRILTDNNFINQTDMISPRIGNEDDENENLANVTLSNELNHKYQNTEIGYKPLKNQRKSTFYKMKDKSEDKENVKEIEIEDKNLGKNKSSDEIIDTSKDKGKQNVVIQKNNKVVLKQTGRRYIINKQNKTKEDNQNNDNSSNNKKINSNDNLNFFDDSKDIDLDASSKNQSNNSNSIKQNYIIIKNDINIKDNNEKNISNKNSNNNSNNPNIKKENIKIKKPSTSNNYLIKKSNNVNKDQIQNNAEDKNKINEKSDIGDKDKNVIYNKNSNSQPTAKFNKNIYIINNINNSEQIQTKNNIYGNKSNNVKINSGGNLNYYNDNSKTNNRKVNINDNANKTYFGDIGRNKQVIKINNNIGNKNINQEKEVKNKTNYNFHDILHSNSQKNNNSYLISNSNTDPTKINEKNYRIENLSTPSHKIPDKKTIKIFQKNSYDYRTINNKGNETNNNTQIMVGRNTENKPGENIYNRTNIGPNNTNINYKISVYTKRSERNAEKNKQNS